MIPRPAPEEYADHYGRYIAVMPDGDLLGLLRDQAAKTVALLEGLSEEEALFRYAEGKWSIKEVLGHLVDTERIFATRGLVFARGDTTPLPGFEQDDYVASAEFDARSLESLLAEFGHLREANIALFASLDEAAQLRSGSASGVGFTARSVPWIIAGHERHHVAVLKERYLGRGE